MHILQNICYCNFVMSKKWRIYFLTLFSYAIIHSLRTMWSAIKSKLTSAPFNYKVQYLGTIDMLTLFIIAIGMNLFGHRVQHYGPKKCLVFTMVSSLIFNTIVGICLNLDLTSQWIYVLFFGVGIGISTCIGWPSCLYMLSYYFDKRNGIVLSAWNGTSQLGDFISLITYFAIVQAKEWPPQSSFFLTSSYLLILLILVIIFIPKHLKQEKHGGEAHDEQIPKMQLHQENIIQGNKKIEQVNEMKEQIQIQVEIKEKEDEILSNEKIAKRYIDKGRPAQQLNIDIENNTYSTNSQNGSHHGFVSQDRKQNLPKFVNIWTVWSLPGVALNVLAYGVIKSVNSFIVSWMVFYLIELDLGSEAFLITILWSLSIFAGGILCGFANKQLNKLFFVFELIASAIAFFLLKQFHLGIYEIQIIIGVIICALFYGGPYNLMSTAIPLALVEQEEVKAYQNGKAAIISLVEGFGLLCCGLSLLIVPLFGISNITVAGAIYCCTGALLLVAQHFRTLKKPLLNENHSEVIAK